ncbi:hypothetical protein BDN72DRAFT_965897 [Pluteus cervinus]|uniref:Uncharacterized protein n=1 Tax=Pluteus cervinus TaxID=181527 RepID=A0ACD3A2B1_9AGAR|nr:hypothetical protein BDN72DRAFT_965897 [Pluteus cervinus]
MQNATIVSDILVLGQLNILRIHDPRSARDCHRELIRLFGTLPYLEHLEIHIYHGIMEEFLKAITTTGLDCPMAFPALKQLGQVVEWEIQILRPFLEYRRIHGREITTLIFPRREGYYQDTKMMDQLKGITETRVADSFPYSHWNQAGSLSTNFRTWRVD